MSAQIIDGKAFSAVLRENIRLNVAETAQKHSFQPGLAVILIGEDPASEVYVKSKEKQTREAGMHSIKHKLPAETSEEALLALIDTLNKDATIDGILVQLPLPAHMNANKILERIQPEKDVDGFHPINVGRLSIGQPALVPCTPFGAMLLLKSILPDLSGKHAIVVGRSNIVGKPMVQLLLNANCTVTIAHSKSQDLPALCRQADILIAAVGRTEMIKADWIKQGAIIIDVGINRVDHPNIAGKKRLVGDVAYDECSMRAGAITPVPGGVGPMTIACLLRNTLVASYMRRGLTPPLGL